MAPAALSNLKAKFKAAFRKKGKKSKEDETADGATDAMAAGAPEGEDATAEGTKTDEHAHAAEGAGEHHDDQAGEAVGAEGDDAKHTTTA